MQWSVSENPVLSEEEGRHVGNSWSDESSTLYGGGQSNWLAWHPPRLSRSTFRPNSF
jgi:hypothetical protein